MLRHGDWYIHRSDPMRHRCRPVAHGRLLLPPRRFATATRRPPRGAPALPHGSDVPEWLRPPAGTYFSPPALSDDRRLRPDAAAPSGASPDVQCSGMHCGISLDHAQVWTLKPASSREQSLVERSVSSNSEHLPGGGSSERPSLRLSGGSPATPRSTSKWCRQGKLFLLPTLGASPHDDCSATKVVASARLCATTGTAQS